MISAPKKTDQALPADLLGAKVAPDIGLSEGLIPADLLGIAPFSDVQRTALDLYKRGLNVLPLPRPHEVKAWAEIDPKRDAKSKPPYILSPFFTSRLHLCSFECKRNGCTAPSFPALFEHTNIGVMTGRTSGNLVAIDCDTRAAFEQIGAELTRRNIGAWIYRTHKGGQYLLRLAEGEAANQTEEKTPFAAVQVWGNRHYVVLPPSIHPLGGPCYQWVSDDPLTLAPDILPPLTNLAALEWLGVRLMRRNWQDPELYDLPDWAAGLSLANRRILANARDLSIGSRNQALTKPCYDIAALYIAGEITYTQGESVLIDAARACGESEQKVRSMFKSATHKHRLTSARDGAQDLQQPWELATAFCTDFDWRQFGRRAQNARVVFLACIERSRLEGEPFRATEREIAELGNLSDHRRAGLLLGVLSGDAERATVKRRKNRGKAAPLLMTPVLIVKIGKDPHTGSNIYKFSDQVKNVRKHPITFTCSNSGVLSHVPKTAAEQDVFAKLGVVAARVWAYLLSQPSPTAAAIARATKQNPSSVARALKRLVAHGLVNYGTADHMYYGESKTQDNLERLAAALGSLGKSDRRKRLNQKDRETRVNRLVARARANFYKPKPEKKQQP